MECDDAARGWRHRRRWLAGHLSHYEPSDSPEHPYVRAQYPLDLSAQLTSKSGSRCTSLPGLSLPSSVSSSPPAYAFPFFFPAHSDPDLQAIRAVRHPERYGPRPDPSAPQSRTQGLSRAILDTFAVVRFHAPAPDAEAPAPTDVPKASLDKAWELVELPRGRASGGPGERVVVVFDPPAGASAPLARPAAAPVDEPVLPAAIGRETCPICITDFADDDALRVLPCAGQHRFHQACVDPWLLELSSSCPLCRQGSCSPRPDVGGC
jgi:hypothetical protein